MKDRNTDPPIQQCNAMLILARELNFSEISFMLCTYFTYFLIFLPGLHYHGMKFPDCAQSCPVIRPALPWFSTMYKKQVFPRCLLLHNVIPAYWSITRNMPQEYFLSVMLHAGSSSGSIIFPTTVRDCSVVDIFQQLCDGSISQLMQL